MMGPVIIGGGGGTPTPPPLVDENVLIEVPVDGELSTYVEEALTYAGRMAPGREVVVRLPEGNVNLTTTVDLHGIDFPELKIVGDWTSTEIYAASSTFFTGSVVSTQAGYVVFDVTVADDNLDTSGIAIGDVVGVRFSVNPLDQGTEGVEYAAGLCGAYVVTAVGEGTMTLRTVGSLSNPFFGAINGVTEQFDEIVGGNADLIFVVYKSTVTVDISWAISALALQNSKVGELNGVGFKFGGGPVGSAVSLNSSSVGFGFNIAVASTAYGSILRPSHISGGSEVWINMLFATCSTGPIIEGGSTLVIDGEFAVLAYAGPGFSVHDWSKVKSNRTGVIVMSRNEALYADDFSEFKLLEAALYAYSGVDVRASNGSKGIIDDINNSVSPGFDIVGNIGAIIHQGNFVP